TGVVNILFGFSTSLWAFALLWALNAFFQGFGSPVCARLLTAWLNIVTVARVERNPTVKNEIAQKGFTRSLPVGFMAYPISQAAD
ncbi:hypothetical protein MJM99_31505, partial [Salmonella enterica subsp. enterica serovar Kentucky]|nr:hypothetical protein [Salmonella enterica subsp. enterica serovar Kentucky]